MLAAMLAALISCAIAASIPSSLTVQDRGGSGLPQEPGNPLADLQRQIDELTAGVAALEGDAQPVSLTVNCGAGEPPRSYWDGSDHEHHRGNIRQLARKINDTDGFESTETAWRSIQLLIMCYRFHRFTDSRIEGHNGKAPLELAGVDIEDMDWAEFSQGKDQ